MSGCFETRAMAKAPDWEITARGATEPFGIGSLYSGMKRVLYLPGTERIPRQLPPLIRGPPPDFEREAARASRILATMASVPPFSSRPPGITMMEFALSSSASWAIVIAAWAAGMTRTKRSTFSGRLATSGTQAQPSISAVPAFTT
jgi:hypothetical protein